MPIYLGSNKISLYRGSNEVSEAYLGSTLVYQNKLPYADGLVIHYDAINNTASGHSSSARSWYDLTGNGNNATVTLSGGDAWGDTALNIAHDSTQVRVPTNIYGTEYTLEFCFLLTSRPTYSTLLRSVNSYNNGGSWVDSSGNVVFRVQSSYDTTSGGYVTTNTMHTVALTRTGNTLQVYIDGVLRATWTRSSSGTHTTFDIFASAEATGRHIVGSAYSFRKYARVLTAAEVLNNYNTDLARFS